MNDTIETQDLDIRTGVVAGDGDGSGMMGGGGVVAPTGGVAGTSH